MGRTTPRAETCRATDFSAASRATRVRWLSDAEPSFK